MNLLRKTQILSSLHQCIGKGKKYTQESIAEELDLDQGRVSRILKGHFVRDGGAVKKLYEHIGLSNEAPATNKPLPVELTEALERNWDGTEPHAEQLIKIIDEIGKLTQISSHTNIFNRRGT